MSPRDLSVSVSLALGLQACTTMPSLGGEGLLLLVGWLVVLRHEITKYKLDKKHLEIQPSSSMSREAADKD